MSEETKQPEAQPQATAPQGEQKAVELTVQDLGVIRSVIDVASQRGAFKANEMEAVGKTYNKLDSFLQQVQKYLLLKLLLKLQLLHITMLEAH